MGKTIKEQQDKIFCRMCARTALTIYPQLFTGSQTSEEFYLSLNDHQQYVIKDLLSDILRIGTLFQRENENV